VWDKPVTVTSSGRTLFASVRIRVNAQGKVESAVLQNSSGLRELDESVSVALPKFTNVPPPLPALLRNGFMEETIEIKLEL